MENDLVTGTEQTARIEDVKTQMQTLYEQLHTKDDQIGQLKEITQKQAVHLN